MFSSEAMAMQVEAIYTSLCGRMIGVNLYADKRFAHFITTDGKYKKIPRYQILSMASYPLDKFPAQAELKIPGSVPYTRLWTFNKGEKVILAEGYVLGSNSSGFQIFTLKGSEVFVSRDSLWKVEIINDGSSLIVESQAQGKYYFSHPHQEKCKEEKVGDALFANELISDPISIKRKFDQQMTALKLLRDYEEAQAFYAIPHIYRNSTAIGYWLPIGNRYGSSEGRASGMAPLIRNEYSKGPFSFQHLSLTGTGPIPDSIHEEPQTMIYYGFKASYLHFAAFIDPALILAGKNYQWQEDDLTNIEDRVVESGYMALGFDRGSFSITLFINSHVFGGFQEENDFTKYDGNLARVGLSWRTPKLILKFNKTISSDLDPSSGSAFDWQDGKLDIMRWDAQYDWSEKFKSELFYIGRTLSFQDNFSSASYNGKSSTFGAGGYYSLTRRWIVGTRLSMEKTENESNLKESSDSFFKMAFHGSMNF
jgi:hypothetical protein